MKPAQLLLTSFREFYAFMGKNQVTTWTISNCLLPGSRSHIWVLGGTRRNLAIGSDLYRSAQRATQDSYDVKLCPAFLSSSTRMQQGRSLLN